MALCIRIWEGELLMSNPLVSAIIITHNRFSEFKKALKSIINQSYQNIEIIVVDNASDDNTKKYLYELDHIKVLSIPEFTNGNVARNKGIQYAHGKYVAFLDDDDEWGSFKVERQVQELERKYDCGVCYTGMKKIYDHKYSVNDCQTDYYSGDLSKKIFESIFTNTSTLMVKRSVLFDNNIFFDEKLTHWQEYDLLVRLSLVTSFINIPEALTMINVSSTSKVRLSNQFDKWQRATEYFYSKYEKRITQLDSYTIRMLRLNYVNDAISRLDNKKFVYWKKSKYILKRIFLTKSIKSAVYLIPGVSIGTVRKISNRAHKN